MCNDVKTYILLTFEMLLASPLPVAVVIVMLNIKQKGGAKAYENVCKLQLSIT